MKFRTPPTPADVLWRELEDWFTDGNGTSHPGPDLMFGGLQAADVERLWAVPPISAELTRSTPTQTTWDQMDNADVSVVTALERGAVASVDRCPSLLCGPQGSHVGRRQAAVAERFLLGRRGRLLLVGERQGRLGSAAILPWRRSPSSIDDLRRLAPDANVELQWDSEGEFFPAIDRFLSARAGRRLTSAFRPIDPRSHEDRPWVGKPQAVMRPCRLTRTRGSSRRLQSCLYPRLDSRR